ncbi:serine/threonine dehydratase [Streptomyces sp. SID10853]|uniref:serine/threonine dehydratase n=1 Tax=Streptomyces sp. SID10853 TaxID=2706028 RepID=UPI001EF25C6E|nr:serine/threonine dehydratase [Streptomyces sp. SID10853]
MNQTQPLSATDVAAAADRIRPHVRRTPLLDLEIDGRRVVLKLEYLQRSGSFKLRGAVNAMLESAADGHIVAASGGNHGLAVATAAALLGLPATIYLPETAPEAKARRIEEAGARLIRHGATFADAAEAAQQAAERPGCHFLHPYNDPAVVAGQGTLAAEVVADAPGTDAFAVAAGGGGLTAGTALAAGGRHVVAVEPDGCRALHDALAAGKPVNSPVDSVASSALGASQIGAVPFGIVASYGVESVLVSDEEILRARDRLWEECRIAVEPAAAASFAAWLAGRVPGQQPCVVLCGANADWTAG